MAHEPQEPWRVHLSITLLAQLGNTRCKEDACLYCTGHWPEKNLSYTLRHPGALVQVVPVHSQNPKQELAQKLCHLCTMVWVTAKAAFVKMQQMIVYFRQMRSLLLWSKKEGLAKEINAVFCSRDGKGYNQLPSPSHHSQEEESPFFWGDSITAVWHRTAEPEGLCKWELYHKEAYWWLQGLQQAHMAFPKRTHGPKIS